MAKVGKPKIIVGDVKQHVDSLLNFGMSPMSIKRFLKNRFEVEIGLQTIYDYIHSKDYVPKTIKEFKAWQIFEKYGEFVNILEMKVSMVALFMERLDKAILNERKTPFTSRSVDETMMKMNEVLNELYKIYQDHGLQPKAADTLKVEGEIKDTTKNKSALEETLKSMSQDERSVLMRQLSEKVIEASKNASSGKSKK